MNVGFATEMMNIGGAATFVLRRALWLKRAGHLPVVLSSGGPLVAELEAAGVVHVEISSFRPGINFTPEQLAADGATLRAAAIHYGLEALIAQAQWPFPLSRAAAGASIPVFWELLSQVYWVPGTPAALQYISEAHAQRRIISFGVAGSLAFSQQYGLDANLPTINVAIEQLPEPSRSREAVRAELGVPDDATLILCVARLDRDRAPMIPHLAAAVRELNQSDCPTHLVVVGDGTEAEALRAQLEGDVIFTGFRRDLADLYGASDLMVSEGSVVQEAATTGLPCIVTNSTMYPNLAGCAFTIFGMHLVDHLFFMPNSVIAPTPLNEALRLLLSDRGRLAEIGRAGRHCVESNWNMNDLMEWQLAYWSGNEPASPAVASAEYCIEIEGGMSDDVDYVAHFLTRANAPEQYSVVARTPVPWTRFFSMPLENAQALSRASWRAIINGGKRITLADLEAELRPLGSPPTDPDGVVDFGVPANRTRLVIAFEDERERALAYAAAAASEERIVFWEPGGERNDAIRWWQARFPDNKDRARLVVLQGAIPWSVMGRLLRGVGSYADSGSAASAARRDLAREMGLPCETF